MDAEALYARYQRLQRYINWDDVDALRVHSAVALARPYFGALVDDFYDEIRRHPEAHKVITGGAVQIERLKRTLHVWLAELFSGRYDQDYVARRWRVGFRHVELGLDQVYTNMALSRLRSGLLTALQAAWQGEASQLLATRQSLNKLLDLDLAIIEDAYQFAYLQRQQRVDRLIMIGQMAGGVAHELRNPLNVIKTSVYYLLNAKAPSQQKTAEHLTRIERQVALADKVITALSDFAKLPFPEVRPITVADSVADALEVAALPSQIEVSTEFPAALPAVLADRDQLRIALTNLIRNARDAMPDGGSLAVTASTSAAGLVAIAVSDSGTGIPPESLGRIMEPLFSTKARGLGLGLAITRAILERHGGGLSATSELGKGSTFTLHLPAAPREVMNDKS